MTTAEYNAIMVKQSAPAAKPRAKRGTGAAGTSKKLENRFATLWHLLGGPILEREYVALPPRKWRFDFAHVPSKLLIEIHGGIWVQGRHTRGSGFVGDRRKMNAATLAGWKVIELTPDDITAVMVDRLIDRTGEEYRQA